MFQQCGVFFVCLFLYCILPPNQHHRIQSFLKMPVYCRDPWTSKLIKSEGGGVAPFSTFGSPWNSVHSVRFSSLSNALLSGQQQITPCGAKKITSIWTSATGFIYAPQIQVSFVSFRVFKECKYSKQISLQQKIYSKKIESLHNFRNTELQKLISTFSSSALHAFIRMCLQT